MFPLLPPTAMRGLYSVMFFMVSAGHMRTTNGGASNPLRIPLVSNLSCSCCCGEIVMVGGRKSSSVARGLGVSADGVTTSRKMILPSVVTTAKFDSVTGLADMPRMRAFLGRRTLSL
jgi:hypothetical protein